MNLPINDPIFKRLMSHVAVNPETGCWEWTGAKTNRGYGSIGVEGYSISTHRLAYEYFKGSLGDLLCLHTCDNKVCINPDHLYAGTQHDNMRDAGSRNPNFGGRGQEILFYPGEVELIRKLGSVKKSNGIRKFPEVFVAKMFKCSPGTIGNIWRSERWLCEGDVYA